MSQIILEKAVAEVLDEIIEIRHDIHEHPEIGMQERRTAAIAAEWLRRCGCDEVAEGVGQTGVVGVIRGSRPGTGMIGFRADMDALAMTEKSGVPWTSAIAGMQHGCGHDGHVATALALASALCADRDFAGTAVIIIQPGEEGFAGAREMIRDGLFERWNMDEVYAQHGGVELPVGQYGMSQGPMMAAADRFVIDVHGVGGHGGRPNRCIDPVVAAAQIIVQLQTIASRSVNPMNPAVVTVGHVLAGQEEAVSVIPERARLTGTTRCMHPDDRDMIERRMGEICQGVALSTGCKVEFVYRRMYPPTINHEEQRKAVAAFMAGEIGRDNVRLDYPASMGAEDFAFMLETRPGCYIRTGTRDEGHAVGAHHPAFDFNDRVIGPTASLFARFMRHRVTQISEKKADK